MMPMQLNGAAKNNFPKPTQRDFDVINAKSREDLAESIEIMIVSERPLNYARIAMRGAVCHLRLEPTLVSKAHAIHALMGLKDRWDEQQIETRSLIVKRAIDIIQTGNAGRPN